MNKSFNFWGMFLAVTMILLSGCASSVRTTHEQMQVITQVQAELIKSSINGVRLADGISIKEQIQFEITGANSEVTVDIRKQLLDESMNTLEQVSRSVRTSERFNTSSYKFLMPGALADRVFRIHTEFWIEGNKKLTVRQNFVPVDTVNQQDM